MKFGFLASSFLSRAYTKGFRNGSLLWKTLFVIVAFWKILKFLFRKAKPKTFQQYDLEPGEYRVVVKENEK